ncbi:fumarylacetoacetate hydrolase family protein [Mesorhizobium koreense]|uniref:fumarylacetoacetate hydrolase family protein n=1 Tax=Mesorhizobium koreense TaxID=3074855 RepID=UPI00287B9B15|nr:fumarylacetoacetate hydrolase family protein [Mesorhizobium sp. WR6]
MRLISYTRCGVPGFGVMQDRQLIALAGRLAPGVQTLKQAIAADLLGAIADFISGRPGELALSDVCLLPVIPDPAKILCIGLNYESHRRETGRPVSEYPSVFVRFADTQVAHGQAICKPTASDALDFEGELAVVIGRGGRNIPEGDAMAHVAGYSCYNDATIRDWQRHTHQFTPGKNFPGTGAFGPWLVTADAVPDCTNLPITTRLNGEVVQSATFTDLIFSIPRLIAYCSAFTPLQAGDVILTGTPGGVGDRREPPLFMKAGDLIEVEIGGVGCLANRVENEI